MTTATHEDRIKEIARICYLISDEATGTIEFLKAGNTPVAEVALNKGIAPVALLQA